MSAVVAGEFAAIAVGNRDVLELANHRKISFAAGEVSADGKRAERSAVVGLAAADDLEALCVAAFNLKLACKLKGGLDRLRASAGEEDGAAIERWSGEVQDLGGEAFSDLAGELAGVNEGKTARLGGNRVRDFGNAEADEVDRSAPAEVDELAPGAIPNACTFSADGDGVILGEGARQDSAGRAGHWGIVVRGVGKGQGGVELIRNFA